jgi:hypothetical protein
MAFALNDPTLKRVRGPGRAGHDVLSTKSACLHNREQAPVVHLDCAFSAECSSSAPTRTPLRGPRIAQQDETRSKLA